MHSRTKSLLHSRDALPADAWMRVIHGRLALPHNTMSTHLTVLTRAGLIRSGRRNRSILSRADLDRFRKVATFLLQDCCGGRPEVCAPHIDIMTPCCAPPKTAPPRRLAENPAGS
jgi:ArsR family transcriptional regulator